MAGWREFIERYCGRSAVMGLFLLCALPVTVLTALVTPPSQSPDEMMHYSRVLGLLHGAVLGVRHHGIDPQTGKPEWQTGVKVNAGLLMPVLGTATQMGDRPVETLQDWNKSESDRPNPGMLYVYLPSTATYFPAAYVPGALGAAVAKLFGATPFHCFVTARLFMAGAFLLVGLAALYFAAYGEAVLVTVLLLPMTLFLSGTMNEDGLLVAMTCLAAACLTRATRGWRIAGLIVFALVLGAKPPYILLIGVFALPIFAPGFWRRFSDMMLAMLPVLGWIVIIALFVVVPYRKLGHYFPGPFYTGSHSVPLDHADAAAQLHILLARPKRFLALPYYSIVQYAYADFISMVGALGLLQMVLDRWVYNVWGFCLACAAAGLLVTRRPVFVPPREALINFIVVLAAIGITYWLIAITFYLDWTDIGLPYIEGIQGRYLLIFLPFVLFAIPHVSALPGLSRVRFSLPPLVLALPSLGMGVYDIGYIPLKLVLNYYLH